MQSFVTQDRLHVGVIMDGNGRWAAGRGLPRLAGHRAGAEAVRRTVEAAPDLGISVLTLYAFSADNWHRPPAEVDGLMDLLERYLGREREELVANDVRVEVIGRRDRLRPAIVSAVEHLEQDTRAAEGLRLRLAIDYSARWAIAAAAASLAVSSRIDPEAFRRQLELAQHSSPDVPDVDLLVRTSGEQRLSDFLLFESAYAELYFTSTLWPDFGAADLARAVDAFRLRDRRYGRLAVRELVS